MKTTEVSGATTQVENYFYDNAGNILERLPEGSPAPMIDAASYSYNEKNQMTAVEIGTVEVENTFNADGYRASKTADGVTTQYLYEYDRIIMEIDSTGDGVYNVYGLSLISREADGDKVYYLYNGHGDVTALVSETGMIVKTYYYDAFGNVLEETGTAENPFLYSGYVYDAESKLYDLKARFYDAKIARFMQEDTYLGSKADPLSLNLYAYCNNNPVIYSDPTGHSPILAAIIGGAVAAAVISGYTSSSSSSLSNSMASGAVMGANSGGALGAIAGAIGGLVGNVTGAIAAEKTDYPSNDAAVRSYYEAQGKTVTYVPGSGNKASNIIIGGRYTNLILVENVDYYINKSGSAVMGLKPADPVPAPVVPTPSVPNVMTTTLQKFVEIATNEKGSGGIKYQQNAGLNSGQSWCAAFVRWTAEQANITLKTKSNWVWDYIKAYGDSSKSGESQYKSSANDYYANGSGYIPKLNVSIHNANDSTCPKIVDIDSFSGTVKPFEDETTPYIEEISFPEDIYSQYLTEGTLELRARLIANEDDDEFEKGDKITSYHFKLFLNCDEKHGKNDAFEIKSVDDPGNYKRSWHTPGNGRSISINVGHVSYLSLQNYPDIQNEFLREQMLKQYVLLYLSEGRYDMFGRAGADFTNLEPQEAAPFVIEKIETVYYESLK